MKDKVVYSVILADKKRPAIKHIASVNNLMQAELVRQSRQVMPGQYVWIGKYVNGILKETIK